MSRLLIAKKFGQAGYLFLSTIGERTCWHADPINAENFARGEQQRDALLKEHDGELVWVDLPCR